MKTAEDLKEHGGLVRDVIAAAGIDYLADDIEKRFRDSLFRKAFTLIPKMEIAQVRRINEAVCKMEFPNDVALALRRQTFKRLGEHHGLKEFRDIKLPAIVAPERPAATEPKGKVVRR